METKIILNITFLSKIVISIKQPKSKADPNNSDKHNKRRQCYKKQGEVSVLLWPL